MGIRGLTTNIQQHGRTATAEFFKDAEVFIDGPNLAHIIVDAQSSVYQEVTYQNIVKDIETYIEDLKNRKPKFIKIIFDGNFPEDKLLVRLERRNNQINQKNHLRNLFCASTILYVTLKEKGASLDVDVSVVGEEADAAIASMVGTSNTPNRKIILSGDSDFYTFRFPGDVQVVSYPRFCEYYKNRRFQIADRAFSVRTCNNMAKKMVGRLYTPPSSFNKSQLDDDYLYFDEMHEFINFYHSTGKLISYLNILDEGTYPSGLPAWTMGKIYRSYAYTLLIKDYCKKNDRKLPKSEKAGEPVQVTEYYQIGSTYATRKVSIFLDDLDKNDENYYNYEEELSGTFDSPTDIADLVTEELKDSNQFRNMEMNGLNYGLITALTEKNYSPVEVPSSFLAHTQASLYSRAMVDLLLNKVKILSSSRIGNSTWKLQKGNNVTLTDELSVRVSKLKV